MSCGARRTLTKLECSALGAARHWHLFVNQNQEWFDCVVEVIDKIDNDLRPKRNQFIHASWYSPGGRATRKRTKTKLHRPQSFQLTLSTQESIPIKIGDARKLRKELLVAVKSIMFLALYFHDPPKHNYSARKYLRVMGIVDRRVGADFGPPKRSSPR